MAKSKREKQVEQRIDKLKQKMNQTKEAHFASFNSKFSQVSMASQSDEMQALYHQQSKPLQLTQIKKSQEVSSRVRLSMGVGSPTSSPGGPG